MQNTRTRSSARPRPRPEVPNPVDVVGATFDQLQRLLELQRDYYTGIAKAYAPLVDQLAADARTTADTLVARA